MRSTLAASLMAGIAAFIAAPGFAQDQTAPAPAADAAQAAPKDYNADTVLATVNGTPITLGNVIVMVGALPPQYQNLPDGALLKGLLDQMVDQQLLAGAEFDLAGQGSAAGEACRREPTAHRARQHGGAVVGRGGGERRRGEGGL
ncbi:MAG: hypothetical protein QM699_04295 [Amaricoccus sp.]|uniref:hypothetical protein n=1 Tax=Amaricoccus sp. TaxID=1872485 RepID=UPI0039E3EF21